MFWLFGVVVGYLPVLLFIAIVPGFALAFWESIRVLLFEIKVTNLPLPVPWPWLLPFGQLSIVEMMRGITIGVFFIAIALIGVLGIIWLIRQRLHNQPVSPALVASIILILPYAHYAFSRADLTHLAGSMPPFLMGIFALLADQPKKIKWPFAALLCCVSLFLMLHMHIGYYCYFKNQCVNINVAGDKLNVHITTARDLMLLNELAEQFIPNDRTFIAAPFLPGAYAILGRKSPMWEIYALVPRNAAFQQAEIERIKAANPCFAIIDNRPLDERDELRFCNTHSIIDQYIRDNFERLNDVKQDFAIYRSKQLTNNFKRPSRIKPANNDVAPTFYD